MWVLVQILDGILGVATTGPHADAESVERVGGYFQLMTVDISSCWRVGGRDLPARPCRGRTTTREVTSYARA